MELGDTVRYEPFGSAWNQAIVKQITATDVFCGGHTATTADFSYTGGVICYIGTEQYTIPRDGIGSYNLLYSQDLK
jgi:hypothetical protein